MVFPVDATAALLGVDADGPIAEVAKSCWVELGSPASAESLTETEAAARREAAEAEVAARREFVARREAELGW